MAATFGGVVLAVVVGAGTGVVSLTIVTTLTGGAAVVGAGAATVSRTTVEATTSLVVVVRSKVVVGFAIVVVALATVVAGAGATRVSFTTVVAAALVVTGVTGAFEAFVFEVVLRATFDLVLVAFAGFVALVAFAGFVALAAALADDTTPNVNAAKTVTAKVA